MAIGTGIIGTVIVIAVIIIFIGGGFGSRAQLQPSFPPVTQSNQPLPSSNQVPNVATPSRTISPLVGRWQSPDAKRGFREAIWVLNSDGTGYVDVPGEKITTSLKWYVQGNRYNIAMHELYGSDSTLPPAVLWGTIISNYHLRWDAANSKPGDAFWESITSLDRIGNADY